MGGKTKQSQRTKNNVRPSSSGRSAELLSNTSSTFSFGSKLLPAVFPTLTSTADTDLPDDFATCMKKLSKKDPITRAKALKELKKLIEDSNVEDVTRTLPAWARLYPSLAADPDPRVRELSQVCMGDVGSKCGRLLGPYVRRVAPAWLRAAHDSHATVASAATKALKTTFPEEKMPQMIEFCSEAIVQDLIQILTGAPETFLPKTVEGPEEVAAATVRLRCSALHAASRAKSSLPPLLANEAFWKLAEEKDTQLRIAWLSCLGQAWESGCGTPDLSRRALRQTLKSRDTQLACHCWRAIVSIITNTPVWYNCLDQKEVFIKRFLEILQNGGWGGADETRRGVALVLSLLPPEMLAPPFHERLIAALLAGLEKKPIIGSKSDSRAWIDCIGDCVQTATAPIAGGLTRSWLTAAFAPRDCGHHLALCTAKRISSLARTTESDNRTLWQSVASFMLQQVNDREARPESMTEIAEIHGVFLEGLRWTAAVKKSVSFATDDDERTKHQNNYVAHHDKADRQYWHDLVELAIKVCARYIKFGHDHKVRSVIGTIKRILCAYDEKEIVDKVSSYLDRKSLWDTYEGVFKPMLLEDGMLCRELVEVVFLFTRHMEGAEYQMFKESMYQINDVVGVYSISVCAEWARLRESGWAFRGAQGAGRTLVGVAGRLQEDDVILLIDCMTPYGEDEEMLVSDAVADAVVGALASSVRAGGWREVRAAARILPGPASARRHIASLKHLLAAMFERMVQHEWEDEVSNAWQQCFIPWYRFYEEDVVNHAIEALQSTLYESYDNLDIDNIKRLVRLSSIIMPAYDPLKDFPSNISKFIRKLFQFPIKDKESSYAVQVSALRHMIITSAINCPYDDGDDDIRDIIDNASDLETRDVQVEEFLEYANKFVFRTFYLSMVLGMMGVLDEQITHDQINNDVLDDDKEKETCDVTNDSDSVVDASKMINDKGFGDAESETDDDTTLNGIKKFVEEILKDQYIEDQALEIIHDYYVIKTLRSAYAYCELHSYIESVCKATDHLIDAMVGGAKLGPALAKRAATKGTVWSMAAANHSDLIDALSLIDVFTGNGYFHTHMVLSRHNLDEEAELRSTWEVLKRELNLLCDNVKSNSKTTTESTTTCGIEHELSNTSLAPPTDPLIAPPIDERYASITDEDTGRCKDKTIKQSLDELIDAYHTDNSILLYDKDISAEDWCRVSLSADAARACAATVRSRARTLTPEHWDFVSVLLCSLGTSLRMSKHAWGSTKMALLTLSVVELYRRVAMHMALGERDGARRDEWRELFATHLRKEIGGLMLHVLESASAKRTLSANEVRVCGALGGAAGALEDLNGAVEACSTALARRPAPPLARLAHTLLHAVAASTLKADAVSLREWSERGEAEEGEEGEGPAQPALLAGSVGAALRSLLDDTRHLVNEHCELKPEAFSCESRRALLAALCAGDAALALAERARGDLALHYIHYYRELDICGDLTSVALALLPEEVLSCRPRPALAELFTKQPILDIEGPASPAELGRLACRCVWSGAGGALAGSARAWRAAAGTRAARTLGKVVETHVTPARVAALMKDVHDNKHLLKDAQVWTQTSSREAGCIVTVEERPLELRVALAQDHPLTAPRVSATASPAAAPAPAAAHAIATAHLHFVAHYLAHQNGSVAGAMRRWGAGVASRVERAPQCYICYSRLRPGGGGLPRARCARCRNLFHHACIRKWFETSKKTECPLCRGVFS